MNDSDRAELIALLDRLGAGDDVAVLEAARALHRKATESGQGWDGLLRDADWEPVEDDTPEAAPPTPDAAETARLIDRLLRRDLSETLREDLAEMKRNLTAGTLDAADGRYIRALARRLGV